MNEEADVCRECGGAFDRCRCGVEEAEKKLDELKAKVREYQDLRDQLDDWRSWKGEEIKRQAILRAADEKFEEIRDLVK